MWTYWEQTMTELLQTALINHFSSVQYTESLLEDQGPDVLTMHTHINHAYASLSTDTDIYKG